MISKLPDVGLSIFSTMSQLAASHDAINLSQGFPDFDCDPRLVELVGKYLRAGLNQYAPMAGVATLREKISEKVAEQHHVHYHPESEVTITAGATQALFTAIAAVINPGDEVIIFEPAYDSYEPAVKAFGGVTKRVELLAPDFRVDWEAVRDLISPKTKLIIINNPNNPSSQVFSDEDYQSLARVVRGTDIIMLSDEVYEHIVFDGREPLSVAQYPELQERTFVVASFGKLYHTTGWKVGYCLAPSTLMAEFRKVHQFNVFSVNTPIQHALADFLKEKEAYLGLATFFQKKRDFLADSLSNTRFKPLPCRGTYFLLVDYSAVSRLPERAFCEELTKQHLVATIPVSAFYQRNIDQQLVRICFAKQTETLERAVEHLMRVKELGVK